MTPDVDGSRHTLFYDTYALYAIARGWPSYRIYARGRRIVTTVMNLYELHYTLLKDAGRELAELFYGRLLSSLTPIDPDTVREAAVFRLQHTKRKLSYIDCLGYITARRHGIPFLTGDKAFHDFPGVEYVK